MTAEELIRKHSKNILNSIDRCTGERKYIISDLLKNIALRAKQLHMIVSQPQAVALMQLSVYVTSLTMNYIHTGWLRGTRIERTLMKKKLKVLMLFYSPYQKPRGYDYKEEFADPDNMYTEKDVQQALLSLGHEVSLLGIFNDITPLFEEIKENRPDIIFNMMEVFNDQTQLEKNMAAVLEILDIPYTGASSGNMFVCNNKALSKKIFTFHHIKVSHFHTYYRGKRVGVVAKLKLPAVIKPLCEEASRGISQASIVDNPESFCGEDQIHP